MIEMLIINIYGYYIVKQEKWRKEVSYTTKITDLTGAFTVKIKPPSQFEG